MPYAVVNSRKVLLGWVTVWGSARLSIAASGKLVLGRSHCFGLVSQFGSTYLLSLRLVYNWVAHMMTILWVEPRLD